MSNRKVAGYVAGRLASDWFAVYVGTPPEVRDATVQVVPLEIKDEDGCVWDE